MATCKTDFLCTVCCRTSCTFFVAHFLVPLHVHVHVQEYTCQLFLRYKREIFILGVLGFLKTTRSFPKIPEEVRSLPKAKLSRKRLSTKSEIARKVLSFIHFTHGFRSLHGSELTYFWKLCQAGRQQLTFFNQA